MKNTARDLNDHLYAALERLGDESLTGKPLAEEITRARAMTGVATAIIENHRTIITAARLTDDLQLVNERHPVRALIEGPQ